MNNNLLTLALYLHILTCSTILFYIWNKIVNIRKNSFADYLSRKRKNIPDATWYTENLKILKEACNKNKDVNK